MSRRTLLRLLATGFLASCAVAGAADPAAAHADLVGTEPGYGAALTSGPDRVVIHYDLPVETDGAQVDLTRSGRALKVARPVHASPDHRDVAVALPDLERGAYLLTWFLFGSDGDVMGGELAFTVTPAGTPVAAVPSSPGRAPPSKAPAFAPLSRAQDAARLLGFMSVTVLVGGVAFVALLWPAGAPLSRTRRLLWAALGLGLVANVAALGLKGAAVQGESALHAFTPAALTALNGTHVGRVLVTRLGFLLLAVPVVAYLTLRPQRALHSHRWVIGAAGAGLGALATHGMLSHAYARGRLASVADIVHLGAVAVWLGGLAMLAVVLLPRRRGAELALILPRWSRLAFACVCTAAVAGTTLLVLISPRWTALPGAGYGRILAVKLTLVALLLVAASRSREFVRRHLPALTVVPVPAEVPVPVGVGAPAPTALLDAGSALLPTWSTPGARRVPDEGVDPVRLRPFVTAVSAELFVAASILTATTLLVGRSPPT